MTRPTQSEIDQTIGVRLVMTDGSKPFNTTKTPENVLECFERGRGCDSVEQIELLDQRGEIVATFDGHERLPEVIAERKSRDARFAAYDASAYELYPDR